MSAQVDVKGLSLQQQVTSTAQAPAHVAACDGAAAVGLDVAAADADGGGAAASHSRETIAAAAGQ